MKYLKIHQGDKRTGDVRNFWLMQQVFKMEERKLRVELDNLHVSLDNYIGQSHELYYVYMFVYKHCLYKFQFIMSLFVYFILLSVYSPMKPGESFVCVCVHALMHMSPCNTVHSILKVTLSDLN